MGAERKLVAPSGLVGKPRRKCRESWQSPWIKEARDKGDKRGKGMGEDRMRRDRKNPVICSDTQKKKEQNPICHFGGNFYTNSLL